MEEKSKVVAFLGPIASYTHQATTQRFPEKNYKIVPQSNIEDVFSTVQNGNANYGVVPFENSSNGSVILTLDLFSDVQDKHPDILVCGEIYLPVHHCLLGHITKETQPQAKPEQGTWKTELPLRALQLQNEDLTDDSSDRSGAVTPTQAAPSPSKPRVKPIVDIKHVKKLYSHPQAWGQCKLFLSTYLKQAERLDMSSTSKAAELVAEDSSGTSAAISSVIAAKLNGLDVLAEGVEDAEGNSTRFFVLRRRQENLVDGEARDEEKIEELVEMNQFKTMVSFTLNHGEPGSLADCLKAFRDANLNLTSINTRPSGEAPWHYIFFVEFMGRKRPDGKGGAVNDALKKLTEVANSWRWLGSWENDLIAEN